MLSCPVCNKSVLGDWDYCFYCGAKLIQENGRAFAYDQLFELMKLEGDRTAQLDSKASTYSGLLGIAITILTAFGGVITIRGFELHEITTQKPISTVSLIILFLLYAFTVLSFIIGAIYAFKAYNLGYSILPSFGHGKINEYIGMDCAFLAKNCEENLVRIQRTLIPHLSDLISNNFDRNQEKSKTINKANTATLFGIFSLILLIAFIVLTGFGLL